MARKPSYEMTSILAAMLEKPSDDHYGLELARQADIATGTVYPILRRLETAGWVESVPENVDASEVGRKPRRLYRLTGLGEREARRSLRQTQGLVARLGLTRVQPPFSATTGGLS